MKSCTKCSESKPLTEFYFSKAKQRYLAVCKPCDAYRQIQYRYGLDRETYDNMAVRGCAICRSTQFLQVDHDHACCPGRTTCGKCVRALLCKRHNVLIGLLRESKDELRAVATYLEMELV